MNDDVIHLLKILEEALIASLKFLIAPFEAERQGFNFHEAFLITTAGGISGILAFAFVGQVIAFAWRKLIRFFKKPLHTENIPRKKFTWFNKFIVRTRINFGLLGLLITTPVIISIPIGTLVINHFYKKKIRNIFFLMISAVVWGLILNSIA